MLNALRELREDAGDRRRAAAKQARFFCDAYGINRQSCFEELVWVADQIRQSTKGIKIEQAFYSLVHELWTSSYAKENGAGHEMARQGSEVASEIGHGLEPSTPPIKRKYNTDARENHETALKIICRFLRSSIEQKHVS